VITTLKQRICNHFCPSLRMMSLNQMQPFNVFFCTSQLNCKYIDHLSKLHKIVIKTKLVGYPVTDKSVVLTLMLFKTDTL